MVDMVNRPSLGDGQETPAINPFLGSSQGIRKLAEAATRSARGDEHVLIVGELGTAKAALARWLYRNGPRQREPLTEFDCGRPRRIPAEFDGNGRSSMTSVPDRGTLLIHHVERMDANTERKFLQAMGPGASADEGTQGIRNLRLLMTREQDSNAGAPRPGKTDFSGRLSSVVLSIPPLRQRREDLPVIACYLLEQLSREVGAGDFDLSRSAITLLQSYSWPGNIRELRSVLQRAVFAAKTTLLTPSDLIFNMRAPEVVPTTAPLTLKEMERQHIERVLNEAGGRVQVAAKLLGLPRSSLYHKLKQYKHARLTLPAAS